MISGLFSIFCFCDHIMQKKQTRIVAITQESTCTSLYDLVLLQVTLNVNQGKDFSEHTIEVNALADPSTLITFAAVDRDLYQRGASTLLSQYEVRQQRKHCSHSTRYVNSVNTAHTVRGTSTA